MPDSSALSGPRPMRRWMAIALLAALALYALGYWLLQGRAVPLPEPGGDRVECVSYAPYRLPGETPFNPTMRVTEARIAEDLRILGERSRCVRTYSVQQGLDAVPRVAQQLGMTVMVGAWIGRDRAENDVELNRAIEMANAYPDTVRALIVGNEVLLRRELPPSELAGYLQRARRGTRVPVTYADVWEFWLVNRPLAEHVSFVTVHILPYWEDEPVRIEQAIEHLIRTHQVARDAFAGRDVLIGETGWPSAGRARREAVPGRVEQARFMRSFVAAAQAHGLRYNLIEAFDQPWKRRMEGAMGGFWGLYDSDGRAKFPWRGPVEQDPRWLDGWLAAGACAIAFAGLAAVGRRRLGALAVHAVAGAATGAVLAAQWRYMVTWNRTLLEWSVTLAFTLLVGLLGWVAADRLAAAARGTHRLHAPGIAQVLAAWRLGARRPQAEDLFGVLRFVFLFGAATMTVLLVADPRYRGFPLPLYAVPAACAMVLAVAGEQAPQDAREERLLAAVIAAGALAIVAMEHLVNPQAWGWLLVAMCLAAWPIGFGYRSGAGSRYDTSAPSSTPTAAGSTE